MSSCAKYTILKILIPIHTKAVMADLEYEKNLGLKLNSKVRLSLRLQTLSCLCFILNEPCCVHFVCLSVCLPAHPACFAAVLEEKKNLLHDVGKCDILQVK